MLTQFRETVRRCSLPLAPRRLQIERAALGAHNCVALRDVRVFVEQAAEAVTSVDMDVSARARLGKWLQRCGLAEGTVRAMVVEVAFVLGQHRGRVPLIDDQDPVQQLAAQAADEPFGDRVRARRPNRRQHDLHAGGGEHGVEDMAEQAFFTDRLIRQRHASGHTVAAYRDTLRLLLSYAATSTGLPPSWLDLADLDAPLIAGFLDHLERDRGNSVRTRNARLAAIHSLFRFAALAHPEHSQSISRVLAIPPKRFDRTLITYLTEPEVDALLASCDRATRTGRRDHALLLLAVQTGLRISELTGLTRRDVHFGPGAHVACRPTAAAAERGVGTPRGRHT